MVPKRSQAQRAAGRHSKNCARRKADSRTWATSISEELLTAIFGEGTCSRVAARLSKFIGSAFIYSKLPTAPTWNKPSNSKLEPGGALMKKRIGIVFGTRPDAIKMAPVVFE